MAIATSTTANAPFAKITSLGDKIVGALASDPSHSKRQQREYRPDGPGELKFKPSGAPLLEEVLHLIAMPGTTAHIGDNDPIDPGQHIRFSVSGYKWGSVIDARKLLPAAAGIGAGRPASGDIYTIELVGWSAETKNPKAARDAGFTVENDRVILRTDEERDKYVLAQTRTGGNTNPAKDLEVTIRRPAAADRQWEEMADDLFRLKPWEHTPVDTANDGPAKPAMADDEPPF